MKVIRKIIEIDEELCDGCGQCVPGCAEGVLQIIGGKARVVADRYCDGLGACVGECPTGALKVVERKTDEFDKEAVDQYLSGRENGRDEIIDPLFFGCPSNTLQTFEFFAPRREGNRSAGAGETGGASSLTHWPIQIRLVPATASFLKGADLLVIADCTAVALPAIHQDLLKEKVVLMGCPKFDDVQDYVRRFADIFKTAAIRSVTTVVMEVPCCSGLPLIVKKGMEAAGRKIPLEEIVVSTRGKILSATKT
jgi:NAD-dependent dihydropyrimidine dehydrogenase PreA subunit